MIALLIGIIFITVVIFIPFPGTDSPLSVNRSLKSIQTAQMSAFDSKKTYVDGFELYQENNNLRVQKGTRVYVIENSSKSFCAVSFKAGKLKGLFYSDHDRFANIRKIKRIAAIDQTGKITTKKDSNSCARKFTGDLTKVGYFDSSGYVLP